LERAGSRLGAYLDDWLERRRSQLRPTTHHSYRQVIRCYLWPALGEQRLQAVDRRMLELAYAGLLARGGRGGKPLAAKTVQYCHGVLRRAVEDALLDGLIAANPARTARPPRHDPGDDEFDDDLQVWTGEQAAAFLAFIDDQPLRALWHLALGTGACRGELLGLRWVDVDLEAAEVRIRRSLSMIDGVPRLLGTKTSRARTLSIGVSVVDALREHRALEERRRVQAPSWQDRWGLVFTGDDGGPIDPFRISREFRALVCAAPVPVIRLHDLRHCNASLLLFAGVPIKVVSERLGHTTIAMTMDVYGHVLPAMDADAATRLDDLLHE
jgi:integrase